MEFITSIISALQLWLGFEQRNEVLTFIGALLLVIIGGAWALYKHFYNKKVGASIDSQSIKTGNIKKSKVIINQKRD